MTADTDDRPVPTPLDRIDQLIRVAAALDTGDLPVDADSRWLAQALLRYIQEAPLGVSLEDALGLSPTAPGQEQWHTTRRRNRRDAVIREISNRPLFASLKISQAAREIAALAVCRQQPPRPFRSKTPAELDQEIQTLIDDALRTGHRFPGAKQIQSILAVK